MKLKAIADLVESGALNVLDSTMPPGDRWGEVCQVLDSIQQKADLIRKESKKIFTALAPDQDKVEGKIAFLINAQREAFLEAEATGLDAHPIYREDELPGMKITPIMARAMRAAGLVKAE